MTNQASEDELEHELDDIVHDALGEVFCRDCEHPRCLNKVKLYKAAIQALIRTEKLKLLAEVREARKSELEMFKKIPIELMSREVADHISRRYAELSKEAEL